MDFVDPPVIVRPQGAVPHAVEQLVQLLPRNQLLKLKVRSGEHLAAILTTVFLYVPPVSIDDDGGTDLNFDGLKEGGGGVWDLMGKAPTAAFEVKSMAGGFLKVEAALGRDLQRGATPTRTHTIVVGPAAEIVAEARPMILQARDQVCRKTDTTTSRNVFLVVHPLERMAVELMDDVPFLASHLDPLVEIEGVDTVWVYWAPDQVTLWSASNNVWLNLIFNAYGVNERPLHGDSSLTLLQNAEIDFLDRIGHNLRSPFVFDL